MLNYSTRKSSQKIWLCKAKVEWLLQEIKHRWIFTWLPNFIITTYAASGWHDWRAQSNFGQSSVSQISMIRDKFWRNWAQGSFSVYHYNLFLSTTNYFGPKVAKELGQARTATSVLEMFTLLDLPLWYLINKILSSVVV